MGFPTIITIQGKLFPASEGAWSPLKPTSARPLSCLYHILSYTRSFLTAQFVLLLTVQGFSERWGGWPCFWVALATAGPAAARPWPQRWPGRSISRALLCPSGPPNPAAKAVSKASRGC
jgi:hypothetical protein